MGMYQKKADGTLRKIAGYTVIADGSCAEVRKGTGGGSNPSSSATPTTFSVTFTDPMPDADYEVIVNVTSHSGWERLEHMVTSKTKNGFNVEFWCNNSGPSAVYFTWTAFKLIPMEGYTELRNKIENPDLVPTPGSTNFVESNGIYEAIKDASAVFIGTRAEWDLATKTSYDLAVLTDEGLILAVDRTTGFDGTEAADLTRVWTGTQAEWDAMSTADKNKWDKALIKDDEYVTTQTVIVKRDSAVAVADWVADTSHSGMNYRCDISVPGVTADYTPDVRFAYAQAVAGVFSSVAEAGTDIVSIYAVNAPTAAFTIPAIICTLMGV